MEGCSASSSALEEALEEDEEDPEICLEETENEIMEKPTGSRSAVLTRRGITLRVLLKDGLVAPGEGVLSIHYLGKKFVGDLLSDGKIRWQETGQIFNSPSAWATHCKKLVNPAKKSGCGWASVRYKGQKLDQYKTTWLMKHQSFNHPTETNVVSEGDDEEMAEEEEDDKCHISECRTGRKLEDRNKKQQNQSLEQRTADIAAKKLEKKERIPVRYSSIGNRDLARDSRTLVEVMPFSALNKFQPFNVAVSSNVLLLLDFHCHLTTSEVVGYLGGRWDANTQLLTVLRAFPCRARLGDLQTAGAVEEEICQSMFMRGLSLVGWYHSHPFSHALPSLQDIDSQMDYQLKLQASNNNFQPCLALICGPYHNGNPSSESKILPFYVMPPPEQRASDYGIPMEVEVTYVQDNFLPSDVLNEMALLVEYYKGAPDLVKFKDIWNQDKTYLDKLKKTKLIHLFIWFEKPYLVLKMAYHVASSLEQNESNPEYVSEGWCHTNIKVVKQSFLWTIDNFSFSIEGLGKLLRSSVFSPGSDIFWRFVAYPGGCDKANEKYMGLYLTLVEAPEKAVKATLRFSILGADGGKLYEAENSKKPYDFKCGVNRGLKNFILRSKLTNKDSGLLQDDRLTILAEISILEGTEMSSKRYIKDPINVPECQLTDDLGELLEKSWLKDCCLCVGGQEFWAHKAVLAACSPVFDAMFHNEMNKSTTNRVEITYMDPEVVKEMLCYAYTGKVPNLETMAVGLLSAADKYCMDHLKEMSEAALCRSMSKENVVELLIMAHGHRIDHLKRKAMDFICNTPSHVAEIPRWKRMISMHADMADCISRMSTMFLEPECKKR